MNINDYLLDYPDSSISASIRRVENIFDEFDEIIFGFSGGKDSALSAQLLIRELKIRQNRTKNGSSNPNDIKWKDKKLWCNIMHCEWMYSDVLEFTEDFIEENKEYVNFFYKTLQLGWTSSVTFGEGRIISWDPEFKSQWIQNLPKHSITNENIKNVNKINGIPNYGLGSFDLQDGYTCWTFPGQDEDHEQETFSMWMIKALDSNKIANIISLRADESYDRRRRLLHANPLTGEYGYIEYDNIKMKSCSPIYDMKTEDVWRAFNLLNFKYCIMYDKMFEAGVPMKNQRIASLLNVYASNSLQSIKALEPNIYQKIIRRFNNVEMIAGYSNNGYYKATKPKPQVWNGKNHIKAGMSKEEIENLIPKYQNILKELNINKYPSNMEWNFSEKEKEIIKENQIKHKLLTISYTWKEYCLHLLNTSSEPARSNWREKMITDILKHKYQGINGADTTVDAFNILVELPNEFLKENNIEIWNKDDLHVIARNKSLRPIITFKDYPQESLEFEVNQLMQVIIKNRDWDMIKTSSTLSDIVFNKWLYNEIESYDKYRYRKLHNLEYEGRTENISESEDDKWKLIQKGVLIWFKENHKCNSSYKKFAIAIIKNDTMLTYLNFNPTYKERHARLNK